MPRALKLVHLDNKSTTVNGVDNNPAAREAVVRPGAKVPQRSATTLFVVITRVHIKEGNFLDACPSWVIGNGRDVINTKASLIVRLESKTVADELIVIHSTSLALVITCVDWLLQVGNVEDICDGESVKSGALGVGSPGVLLAFIKLIINKKVRLIVWVEYPSLML
jgi:hypothetical protein